VMVWYFLQARNAPVDVKISQDRSRHVLRCVE
jgi:hypothetical protein